MGICDTLKSILTYIYLNLDEYWLTSSISEQMFNFQISHNYGAIRVNVVSKTVVTVWNLLSWLPHSHITLVNVMVGAIRGGGSFGIQGKQSGRLQLAK